ncbi:MAG: hypothetical protein MZV65_47465 [Chromatiales bacterium]|nr:hypothetical protein [Chromatiales bacterium]
MQTGASVTPTRLKIEFKQPLAGRAARPAAPGQAPWPTGITGDWRRIRVPLNLMSGIADSGGVLRQFGIESQTAPFAVRPPASLPAGRHRPAQDRPARTQQPRSRWFRRIKTAWENRHRRQGGGPAPHPRPAGGLAGTADRPIRRHRPDRRPGHSCERLARDTWRGLAALSDREHGLPLDTVRSGNGSTRPRACLDRRLHQRHQHRPVSAGHRRGACELRLIDASGRPWNGSAGRWLDPGTTRNLPGIFLQLLRHHYSGAYQQLRLVRGFGLADRRADGGARRRSRAGHERCTRLIEQE